MKHIQLNGSKFHSSSPATDTKLELVREAIDSVYRIEEGNYPFSPASPNRKGHLSKFTLLSIAAICGPLLAEHEQCR
jgi:hypothetical protein